jgi:hypothetical protein
MRASALPSVDTNIEAIPADPFCCDAARKIPFFAILLDEDLFLQLDEC